MSPEVLTIIVLVAMFLLATVLDTNLGVLGFIAAFGVGTLALGMGTDEIVRGFPAGVFVILVGLTYLFALAAGNGTVDLIVGWSMRLVRGRAALVPWIFFVLAAVLCAIGAVYAVAIVAPLAMPFARRYRIDPLLMGMMVVHGALGGAFSPISIYGSFINGLLPREGIPSSPSALFLTSLAVNVVIAAAVYVVFGGLRIRPPAVSPEPDSPTSGGGVAVASPPTTRTRIRTRIRTDQVVTLVGIGTLAVGTVAFGLDVGFLAMCVAGVVSLVSRDGHRAAMASISWSTVLLVCGVITYLGVLQAAGTIDYLGGAIAGIGLPLVAALLLCYLGGITSAFASSIGILSVVVPLAVPFLQQGTVGVIGMVSALAVSATIVDVCPFSTNGALVLANADADERPRLFRRMLVYSGAVVALGPLLAWALLVAPGWSG
jgi:di/tricarboxylate transporter